MNPYLLKASEAAEIMRDLIKRMSGADLDDKTFKNMAAVYVQWQQELQALQCSALEHSLKPKRGLAHKFLSFLRSLF
jgi:hypothetical protein